MLKIEKLEKAKLFNLSQDPSERFDLIEQHPEVVEEIEALAKAHQASMVFGETQLESRLGTTPR